MKHQDAGSREIQPLGEEGAAGCVGSTLHGRRGEPPGYPVGHLGDQLVLRSPRLHMDGKEDVAAILSDDRRVGSHLGVAGLSGMAASRRS